MHSSADAQLVHTLAHQLDRAACEGIAMAQISAHHILSIEDAYRVQQALVARREDRGERRIDVKMGFTSIAKMAQMGVHDQIIGTLTDAMFIADHGSMCLDAYIHPRCEPEIAFLLKKDLKQNITLEEAIDAIQAIAPAIEIIDSRYEEFRFSLADVIADNASSAAFVIGEWVSSPCRISQVDVELLIDGEVSQSGSTEDVLGNPVQALVAAARLAAISGRPLKSGDLLLTGAATVAIALQPGMHIQASFAGVGNVNFNVAS